MATRTRTGTVTFARPFFLRRIDRELPAGSYPIETDEEALEGVSTPSYRRVEIRLFVPRIAGRSEAEMWVIAPDELDDILMQDREPFIPHASKVDIAASHPASTGPVLQEIVMSNPNKSSNLPLYGAGLGILALLFATWVHHQQNPEANSPPPSEITGQN